MYMYVTCTNVKECHDKIADGGHEGKNVFRFQLLGSSSYLQVY